LCPTRFLREFQELFEMSLTQFVRSIRRHTKASNQRPMMEPVEARQFLSGSVTPSLVAVPITSGAKTADPALNGFSTYDLQVTVTGTDHWTAGQLLINLSSGSFYIPSGAEQTPQHGSWGSSPNLEFHNFVSGQNFADPLILGGVGTGESATISAKKFSIAFGVIGSMNSGTFTIARVTMTTGAVGILTGKVGDLDHPGVLTSFSSSVPFTGTVAQIKGYVWDDTNADAGKNNGEINKANVQVYVDENLNGHLDPGEHSARTRSNGNFTIPLDPGQGGIFRLRVNPPTGFRRTYPNAKSFWQVNVIAGASAENKRFGVTRKVQVTGAVFLDANRNKIRDSGEAGLSGFTVFADKDFDGIIDPDEVSAVTNKAGNYTLKLDAGTYIIRLVQKTGFRYTSPSGILAALPSGSAPSGVNFGERKA
jgi:hypothetical protein